jgi:hypothetical protein
MTRCFGEIGQNSCNPLLLSPRHAQVSNTFTVLVVRDHRIVARDELSRGVVEEEMHPKIGDYPTHFGSDFQGDSYRIRITDLELI